jgi:DNA (cytosine-5)-methyltransferase 1
MKIKLLELFSGIGGFSKGLMDAGIEITDHWFSDIDFNDALKTIVR